MKSNAKRKSNTMLGLVRPDFVRQDLRSSVSKYAAAASLEVVAAELGVEPLKILKLDSGENLFSQKIGLKADEMSEIVGKVALYPDSDALELRTEIAKYIGVQSEQILIGNGSDELIDLLCTVFLDQNRTLLDTDSTFPMYSKFAKKMGAKVVIVPRNDDFSLNISRLKKTLNQADLMFIANPNNPTGTITENGHLEELLEIGKPIVIDEAYFEFYGTSALELVRNWPNAIVLRTFSKWAGLAGLRVGYMIADPALVSLVQSIKQPYSVNSLAQFFALKVLQNPQPWLTSVEEVKQGRDWFVKNCSDQKNENYYLENWKIVPSQASCITLIPRRWAVTETKLPALKDGSSEVIANTIVATNFEAQKCVDSTLQLLKSNGILVKKMNIAVGPIIRISAAPQEQMKRVAGVMRSWVKLLTVNSDCSYL